MARRLARQLLGKLPRLAGRTGYKQMNLSAIDDGIVGAPHRGNEIGMWRTQRRRTHSVADVFERKAEFECLVERDFKYARYDLCGAGKALGRGKNDRQLLRRKPAIMRNLFDDRRRRRYGALQHQRAAAGMVAVGELLEQRFALGECARRPGAQREKRAFTRTVR